MSNRLRITARGWPWQLVDNRALLFPPERKGERYGWNPLSVKASGRYGGGWAFKFGVTVSSDLKDWVFDLGLGSIRATWRRSR